MKITTLYRRKAGTFYIVPSTNLTMDLEIRNPSNNSVIFIQIVNLDVQRNLIDRVYTTLRHKSFQRYDDDVEYREIY